MATRQQFDKRTILLRGNAQRDLLLALVGRLPLDEDRPLRVVIDDPLPAKSRDIEQKYHAMIGDIARQYEHCGRKWDAADMKRILIDQFKRDTIKDPAIAGLWHSMGVMEMAPALDGSGVVMLGAQSRNFPMALARVFVEWLYALGAELQIKWTEPKKPTQERQ